MKIALVIGFGSIGKLHAKILNELGIFKKIYVLTSQRIKKYPTISNISQIQSVDPDYIVIAATTNLHYKYLNFLDQNFKNKKILIEKPIFHKYHNFKSSNKNKINVGYNLRFNPTLVHLKKVLKNKKILSANISCTSYLPDWRKKRDYKNTSSANKGTGGGVLLDLSHELDYILLLFGKLKNFYSSTNKISNLKITTDDFLNLIGSTEKKIQINLTLNYFSLISQRRIEVICNNFHVVANLLENKLFYYKNNRIYQKSFGLLDREYSYKKMHNDYLNNNKNNLCSLKEALEVMKIIDRIRKQK